MLGLVGTTMHQGRVRPQGDEGARDSARGVSEMKRRGGSINALTVCAIVCLVLSSSALLSMSYHIVSLLGRLVLAHTETRVSLRLK